MLTLTTQTAIAVLARISREGYCARTEQIYTTYPLLSELLTQLEVGGLIRLLPNRESDSVTSYCLTRSITEISLLDILLATGEHINCNLPLLGERYYFKYGRVAHKLGVLNSIMRNFLSDIKLNEL